MIFWYLSHISKYLGSIDCSFWCSRASHINSALHLCIHTLWMQTANALVSLHIYKACLSPLFLTLQRVLRCQFKCAGSFDLFFVTNYNLFSLIWNIQRINRMQLYNYDHVPTCTKFNIKQNYTVKLSLIDRNNSNKKSQWIVEVLLFSHVYYKILTMQWIFSKQ